MTSQNGRQQTALAGRSRDLPMAAARAQADHTHCEQERCAVGGRRIDGSGYGAVLAIRRAGPAYELREALPAVRLATTARTAGRQAPPWRLEVTVPQLPEVEGPHHLPYGEQERCAVEGRRIDGSGQCTVVAIRDHGASRMGSLPAWSGWSRGADRR